MRAGGLEEALPTQEDRIAETGENR